MCYQKGFINKFMIILIGFILVIAISFGVFYYRNNAAVATTTTQTSVSTGSSNDNNPFNTVATAEAAKKVSQIDELKVTIATPKLATYFTKDETIKIAGATKKGSTVVIVGGKNTVILGTNDDGSFAPDIELNEGVNELIIEVFGPTGQQKKESRTIVMLKDAFSEDKLDLILGASAAINEDGEKIDITTDNDKITSFTTTKQTKWYNINDDVKKQIRNQKLEDLPTAIISLADDPTALAVIQYSKKDRTIKSFLGEVTDKKVALGGTISIQTKAIKNDQEQNNLFEIESNTVIRSKQSALDQLKPLDIKIGDKVVLTYVESETSNSATNIFIIPGRASSLLKDLKNTDLNQEDQE